MLDFKPNQNDEYAADDWIPIVLVSRVAFSLSKIVQVIHILDAEEDL